MRISERTVDIMTFEFEDDKTSGKKIKSLHIEFW